MNVKKFYYMLIMVQEVYEKLIEEGENFYKDYR